MQERWVAVRKREEYRDMKDVLHSAINEYWASMSEKTILWTQQIYACEQITLKAYRTMKYLRKEHLGLNPCIDDSEIGDTQDMIIRFYSLTDDSKTSYQHESDVLEGLSRAAYREMKTLKQTREELDEVETISSIAFG